MFTFLKPTFHQGQCPSKNAPFAKGLGAPPPPCEPLPPLLGELNLINVPALNFIAIYDLILCSINHIISTFITFFSILCKHCQVIWSTKCFQKGYESGSGFAQLKVRHLPPRPPPPPPPRPPLIWKISMRR